MYTSCVELYLLLELTLFELRQGYESCWLARSKKEQLERLALAMDNSEAVYWRRYVGILPTD